MYKLFKVLFLLSAIVVYASENERMEVTFNTDEKGNTKPSIFIPMYWSANWYSGVGYNNSDTMSVTSETLNEVVSTKTLTASQEEHIWLNILNYQNISNQGFGYSLGLAVEYKKISNEEFGVLNIDSQINQTENSTKINLHATSLNAELVYKDLFDFISLRLGTYIAPNSKLTVKQSTEITPLLSNSGTSNSSSIQKLSYKVSADVYLKTGSFIDISLNAKYENLPLQYDVSEPNFSTNLFESSLFTSREKTTTLSAKCTFMTFSIGGMNPMVGYSKVIHDNSLTSSQNGTLDYNIQIGRAHV